MMMCFVRLFDRSGSRIPAARGELLVRAPSGSQQREANRELGRLSGSGRRSRIPGDG
jgi:hypothetical protein